MRLLSNSSLGAVDNLSNSSSCAVNGSGSSAINGSSQSVNHLSCSAINSLSSLLGIASAREERYTKNNSK